MPIKATFDIFFEAAIENSDAEGGIRTPVGQSPTSFPGARKSISNKPIDTLFLFDCFFFEHSPSVNPNQNLFKARFCHNPVFVPKPQKYSLFANPYCYTDLR